MIFSNFTIIDEAFEIKENMYVGVVDDRIDYIGNKRPDKAYGEEIKGNGRLLMPSFYNAHAHTPMTLLRSYGGGLNLNDWLTKKIFPFEAHLTGDDIYYGAMLGIVEMLRTGTVSTTDMYMAGERILEAFIEGGIKTNLGVGLICFDKTKKLKELSDYVNSKHLYENYHGAENGRIKIDMSVHGEYTSFPGVVEEFCDYSRSLGTNMNVHLSETHKEHEECKQRHGKTPAAYFNDLGMFDSPTTAAHCVWLEEEDFDIFAQKGVSVATCPVSNLKLASGICDLKRLYEKDINVALGTDGVASNNNLDMIEEMKYFALLQNVKHMDPTVINPAQAIKAATYGGAKAQGRGDCGRIKVGNKADLIVINIDKPHLKPVHSMLDNLVFAANGRDVEMTVCDGRVLYKNGEYYTIDVERVVYEVGRSSERILSEL